MIKAEILPASNRCMGYDETAARMDEAADIAEEEGLHRVAAGFRRLAGLFREAAEIQ